MRTRLLTTTSTRPRPLTRFTHLDVRLQGYLAHKKLPAPQAEDDLEDAHKTADDNIDEADIASSIKALLFLLLYYSPA